MPSSLATYEEDDENSGSSDGVEYEVQEIRGKRTFEGGETRHLVHWKGYGTEDDSWEADVSSCPAKVRAFERRQRQADNSSRSSSFSSSSSLEESASEDEPLAKRRKQARAPALAAAAAAAAAGKGRKRKALASQRAKPKRDASNKKKAVKKRQYKCEYNGCDAAFAYPSAL